MALSWNDNAVNLLTIYTTTLHLQCHSH